MTAENVIGFAGLIGLVLVFAWELVLQHILEEWQMKRFVRRMRARQGADDPQ